MGKEMTDGCSLLGVIFSFKYIVWNPPGFQGKLPEAHVSLRRNTCVFVFLGGLTFLRYNK